MKIKILTSVEYDKTYMFDIPDEQLAESLRRIGFDELRIEEILEDVSEGISELNDDEMWSLIGHINWFNATVDEDFFEETVSSGKVKTDEKHRLDELENND